MTKPQHGELPWSPEEVAVIARAASNAPSIYGYQPWSLGFRDRSVTLYECVGDWLASRDSEGRGQRISCGAALANLVLAIRSLGWASEVSFGYSQDEPDVVARVTAVRRQEPAAQDFQRFRMIAQRTSYRNTFADPALSQVQRDAIRDVITSFLVHGKWISGHAEALPLARLLAYAARVYRGDEDYERELATWAPSGDAPKRAAAADSFVAQGFSAVDLVTAPAHVPDEEWLASHIEHESILVLSTPVDGRRAHIRAGEAMELVWLAAIGLGLVASVLIQPLHLSEVRWELAARLGLEGIPQMLMRFGYPSMPPGPDPLLNHSGG